MTKTEMDRKVVCFHVGRIAPRPRCTPERHIGPFTPDDVYGAWVQRLASETGMGLIPASYAQCQHCLSHTVMPVTEAAPNTLNRVG